MEPEETDPNVTVPSATDLPTTDAPAGRAPADEPATGRTGGRAAFVLSVTLAVAFGLLAAVLAVLLADARSDAGDDASDLRRTAGQFGEALVTYDHRDPEAHRDAVLGMATGSFREEYEDAFEGELVQIITEVEAVSQGFVKDVFVSEIDEESASAVVVVDVEHDGAAGPRTLYDIYFRLTFVRVGGDWKVDQVIDLNFGNGPSGGETDVTTGTTGTTTTSVP